MSRDVVFDEEQIWRWDATEIEILEQGKLEQGLQTADEQSEKEDFDDIPVKDT